MLYDHPFIPSNEIHSKIGGDHGGGSFKMEFQVGNVEKPNKPENTVIFSIAEAKDYKVNIALCVERVKAQIEYFKEVKWQDKEFRVFLFGDYFVWLIRCQWSPSLLMVSHTIRRHGDTQS